MKKSTPDNADDTATCQIVIEMHQDASATFLQPKYASAEEAIGAVSRELMKSGRPLTYQEMQVMLVVRLKLSTDMMQQVILREALMLILNKQSF